ncbi:uncharacterized protein A4U43_C07F38800 [Asparagus officinalis]|uniref:Syntaxin N-terminal domain-containing protein n=1 Tax=Asparagus officinalis TaxID=4686 RepID=A0A5P1EI40_ASPOF|nr:uncharacterized protein A4U43_C07F38800 [Asparagus officinalis]
MEAKRVGSLRPVEAAGFPTQAHPSLSLYYIRPSSSSMLENFLGGIEGDRRQMSLGDPETGGPLAGRRRDPNPVAADLMRTKSAVLTYEALVDELGTPKDTLNFRQTLHRKRFFIERLVKATSAKIHRASEDDYRDETGKRIADAELTEDFRTILNDFQKATRLATERESAYAPIVPKAILSSSLLNEEIRRKVDEMGGMCLHGGMKLVPVAEIGSSDSLSSVLAASVAGYGGWWRL